MCIFDIQKFSLKRRSYSPAWMVQREFRALGMLKIASSKAFTQGGSVSIGTSLWITWKGNGLLSAGSIRLPHTRGAVAIADDKWGDATYL